MICFKEGSALIERVVVEVGSRKATQEEYEEARRSAINSLLAEGFYVTEGRIEERVLDRFEAEGLEHPKPHLIPMASSQTLEYARPKREFKKDGEPRRTPEEDARPKATLNKVPIQGSWTAVPDRWLRDGFHLRFPQGKRGGATELLLYYLGLGKIHAYEFCFPSIRRTAEDTGLSPNFVRKLNWMLERVGILRVKPPGYDKAKKKRGNNVYVLELDSSNWDLAEAEKVPELWEVHEAKQKAIRKLKAIAKAG
jgi:hypothetical protein